jgi:hypothetical protein
MLSYRERGDRLTQGAAMPAQGDKVPPGESMGGALRRVFGVYATR